MQLDITNYLNGVIMRTERKLNELRDVVIKKNVVLYPYGSVLICMGKTKVLCNVSVNDRVPKFLKGQNRGWLTAEYAMLPSATHERNQRESIKGKLSGRTMEIQRLIGRSLRKALDFNKMGEMTFVVDCDVIQADGGTRTAAITGSYIALELAVKKLLNEGKLKTNPLVSQIAAISVGILNNSELLDLEYSEDNKAEIDMNVVMNEKKEFIELQGTGEEDSFSKNQLFKLIELAEKGITELLKIQREAIDK